MAPWPTTFESLLDGIQRQGESPNHHDLSIPLQLLRDSEQVKTVARAIRANATATKIMLIVGNTRDNLGRAETRRLDIEWAPLLNVLEQRAALRTVGVLGSNWGNWVIPIPDHIVSLLRHLLFGALQGNANIRELLLWDDLDISSTISEEGPGGIDVISFLTGTGTLQKLSLWQCDGSDAQFVKLANALRSNATIMTLSLSHLRSRHVDVILEGLASREGRSQLKELRYTPMFWDDNTHTLERYLQSRACTIESVKLSHLLLSKDVLRHLRENLNVNKIEFHFCSGPLGGEQALCECLTSAHLAELRLENCWKILDNSWVRGAFCASLVGPSSSLKSLYLSVHHPRRQWSGTEELLGALSRSSRLECLTVKIDRTSFTVPVLAEVIPSLKVEHFTLVHEGTQQKSRDDAIILLEAIKKNLHFQNVAIEGQFPTIAEWPRSKEKLLTMCRERNTKLVKWRTTSPDLVPGNLLSYGLAMASKAGISPLYGSLVCIFTKMKGAPDLKKMTGAPDLAGRRVGGKRMRMMTSD